MAKCTVYNTSTNPFFLSIFVHPINHFIENMMRKITLLLIFFGISTLISFAQVVTTNPLLPNGDKEITLIFDLKLAKDARAKGLLGKTSDVYVWAGAGTTETGDAFEYQPAGQTDFSKPLDKAVMTALGNDVWSIKLTPRTYFAVPTTKIIKRLGLILKNGAGTAQTEDLFISLYDVGFSIAFLLPTQTASVLKVGQNVPISIKTTEKALLTAEVSVGDVVIPSAASLLGFTKDSVDTFTKTLNYTDLAALANANSSTIIIKVQGKGKTGTSTTQISLLIPPKYITENVPATWKDGINYLSDIKVGLVLFAPFKEFVYVLGEFNNWIASSSSLMKRSEDGTRYWLEISNLEKGKEYAFYYSVDGILNVADPYSEKILDPNNDKYIPSATYPSLKTLPSSVTTIASVLQTGQTPYTWKTTNFKRPAKEDLIIYELHIRDFSTDKNYKAVLDTLSYLKKLGINAIELMPIQEFTGNDSWGYNPTFYFAPDKAYGTANDLKTFVDKCHEQGIAVLLDMVFNQADYEFPYVKMYWNATQPSANSPFFNQQATHPFSVFFDFNHESAATRNYVNRANQYWLTEYHIDGYRFDLAKGFTQKISSDDSQFRLYDASRVAIWKNYVDAIRKVDTDAFVILELFSEDAEERDFVNYGMMVWGNHNYDFRGMAKGDGGNPARLSYRTRGMSNPGVVGYMESHDEERVMYDVGQNGKASGSYTAKDIPTALDRIKANAALFLSVPGPKMIWQFGELGYDINIDYNGRTGAKPLKWTYLADANRAKLYKAFGALNQLKTKEAIFKTTDFELDMAGMQKKVTLNSSSNTVVTVANFDLVTKPVTKIFPKTGKWYDFFTGTSIDVMDTDLPLFLAAGEFHVFSTTPFAKPAAGLVPWTVPTSLMITATQNEPSQEAKLYPNPVEDWLTIELPENQKGVVLIIYDIAGRSLYSQPLKETKTQISVQHFLRGTYFAHLQSSNYKRVVKFIKTSL